MKKKFKTSVHFIRYLSEPVGSGLIDPGKAVVAGA